METWGKDCDGYMASSDKTDPSIGAVKIMHKGEESWSNMWQKMRSTWSYIADNYAEDYDWFFVGGDDVFLVAENLRRLLTSHEVQMSGGGKDMAKPMYLGEEAFMA